MILYWVIDLTLEFRVQVEIKVEVKLSALATFYNCCDTFGAYYILSQKFLIKRAPLAYFPFANLL